MPELITDAQITVQIETNERSIHQEHTGIEAAIAALQQILRDLEENTYA